MNKKSMPVGYQVKMPENLSRPEIKDYHGQFVSLLPVNPQDDIDDLFECSNGTPQYDQIWTYMPYGPFEKKSEMLRYLENCMASSDPLFFTVADKCSAKKRGIVSFLNIVEAHLTVELGHIWYSPLVQRSKVNTECMFLMLSEAFDRKKYRRVEWKCNALNARSRVAAQRLGFSFEGVFLKHFVHKGRNRDTAWFAMLDDDWIKIKPMLERFLYADRYVDSDGFSLTKATKPILRALDSNEAKTSEYYA